MRSHTIQELVAMEPILGASRDELERPAARAPALDAPARLCK